MDNQISYLYTLYQKSSGVCTDTRNIGKGTIFFALRGDSFNGNTYAAEALGKGASYVVVDEADAVKDDRYVLVADVLIALQELAKFHRKTFDFPVIGLTGSNGKTTTKELIAAVLSSKYAVYATKGNLNNHIGVPLTLLSVDPSVHEIVVIEMGANHQKEIALLSSIAQPTHGLITNVGKAHLEGFGGYAGVKKGKGELYDYLSKKKRTVFVNAQNEELMEMVSKRHAFEEIVFYRSENGEVNPVLLEDTPFVVYEDEKGRPVTTHLPGSYNFDNVCAALAVGVYFEISPEDARDAVSSYKPDNNRSQLISKGTNTVILDAYNANPSSMAAAVANFRKMTAKKKVAIIGDMLELGTESEAEHLALGELIAEANFDLVILSGKQIQAALPALPRAYYFPDKFSLHNWVMDNPQENTHFLIKGSRGIGLESVVQFL